MSLNANRSAPLELKLPQTQCWVCDSKDLRHANLEALDFTTTPDLGLDAYNHQNFWLQECRHCGFIQPDWLPTLPDFFDRLYNQKWSEEGLPATFASRFRDFIYRGVLRSLSRRVTKRPRSLLDVGSGVGRFISLAAQDAWNAEGVEVNPRMRRFSLAQTKLPIHEESMQSLFAKGARFDAVTFLDVLEHIPNPASCLKAASDLLHPGGWLVVKVPHGKNQLRKQKVRQHLTGRPATVADNMVHVNHFSPASLRLALEKTGFDRIRVVVGAPEFFESTPEIKSRVDSLFRLTTYWLARCLPMEAHSPLAFNLLAIARRKNVA